MEGLVLSTVFISFAILAWLVIAKFGGNGRPATGNGSDKQTNFEQAEVNLLNDSGPTDSVVHASGGSASVDMPDDGCDTKISPVNNTDKRIALDEAGDDSCGQGTPTTNRRLSRRQRKNNRKREKDEKGATRKSHHEPISPRSKSASIWPCLPPPSCPSTPEATSLLAATTLGGSKSKKKSGAPCKQYQRLGLQDYQIYHCLMNYKLEEDRLRRLGFPMESELHPGKACVYQDPEFGSKSVAEVDDDDFRDEETTRSRSSSLLDVNAREFFPCGSLKSPHQSTSPLAGSPLNLMDTAPLSSEKLGSSLEIQETPVNLSSTTAASTSSVLRAAAKEFVPSFVHKTELKATVLNPEASGLFDDCENKQCARCSKMFYVTSSGQYLVEEACTYHWGKLRGERRKDRRHENDRFTCCSAKAAEAHRGCCQCRVHVWRNLSEPGMHGPLDGFVRTRTRKCFPPDGNYGIYSLDGEMCFTTNGLEVIKLTVVGVEGRLVYETLILPDGEIVDYNTRFSGISARDLKKAQAKTLREVQNDVMGFVNANTILIGHGLENDLRALKIVHTTIIDTSIVFPHYYGLPYRRSLKSLVKSYLNRDIQAASWGHDSYEDARACIELMLWKVRKDLPLFGAKQRDFSLEDTHQTVFVNAQQRGNVDQLGI